MKEIKRCKHRGWLFEIKILWWKKTYLFCERCKKPILWRELLKTADILHNRSDGYFMTSLED